LDGYTILNQLLKITPPWKAKIITKVANKEIIVTGLSGVRNLVLNHSSPFDESNNFLVQQANSLNYHRL